MDDPIAQELYFLIYKYLSSGPCKEAAAAIKNEIEKHNLVPKRIDWLGNEHPLDFNTFTSRNSHITDDFLLKIVSRIGSLLNNYIPSSVLAVNTLLGSGSQSLLRTSSDITHQNETHFLFSRLHKAPLKLSSKRNHNHFPHIVNIVNSREFSGPGPITSTLPTQIYDKFIRCKRLLGHLACVYCVSFDRTGRYIFTGADDMLIKIWSAVNGRLLATLRGHSAEISDITVNYENTLLAAGSCDKMIRVWCIKTTKPICVLTGHTGMITSLKFCPYSKKDDRYLVSTSNDGTVCFWQWNVKTYEFNPNPIKYVERIKQGAHLICFSFSAGGSFLAVGSSDHYVRVYHVSGPVGPAKVLEIQPHLDQVDSLQFSNTGLRFVSGSKDGTANIWKYERQEWHSKTLQMSENLPGQQVSKTNPEISVKLKVSMVGWSLDDVYVITAVNDHSIKIWESNTGKLKYVLKEHDDEVYIIEAHPVDPRVFLSGGHDGKIFLWDLSTGKHIKMFFNQITGQGYGSIFDCKWSPDGQMFACTDSHGHLSIFSFGDGEKYRKIPDEVFFHTDYRPLIRDSNHYVIDEQTQCAPHLMPPPFLVDIDGNPYPPNLQRLVPGREHCKDEQLVPYIAIQHERGVAEILDPRQDQQPNSPNAEIQRPTIDDMIERLQAEQANRNRVNEEHRYAVNSNDNSIDQSRNLPASDSFSSSNRPGARRSGDVEGVRQSVGNWQSRGENISILRRTRQYVSPLLLSEIKKMYEQLIKLSQVEEESYFKEAKKKPITTALVLKEIINKERLTRRKKQMILQRRGIRNNLNNSTRNNNRPSTRSNNTLNEDEPSIQSDDSNDTSFSLDGVESWQESSSSSENQSDDSSDDDWQFSRTDQRSARTKRKSQRNRNFVDSEESHTDEQPRSSRNNVSSNLDEPSTSSGITRQSNKGRIKKQDVKDDEEVLDLPDAYKPPEWLTEVVPKRTPYFPQIGDEVIYFRKGHELYIEAVRRNGLYNIHPKTQPLNNKHVKDQQLVKVKSINYEVRPPRLVILQMKILNEENMEETGENFTLKYHDMPDVIDFLILKQFYDNSIQRNWKPDQRFRSIIDNTWWFGTIKSIETNSNYEGCPFQNYRVIWDSKEEENMSAWDLEPCTERFPDSQKEGLSITEEERSQLMYLPKSEDWPSCGREIECDRLINGLEKIMQISWAENFNAPVDLNEYPSYAKIVAYPIDLSTIKARLENRFYRSLDAVKFDVSFIEKNARLFNEAYSMITRNAKLITALLQQFIEREDCMDPTEIQQEIHQNKDMYESTESELDDDQENGRIVTRRQKARNKNDPNWISECKQLLNNLFHNVDSEPFRNPVDFSLYEDYLEKVGTPMDLSTIKEQLYSGWYSDPKDLNKDLKLIFQNSKIYNTDKRSNIYIMTLRLQSLVTEKMKIILNNYKQETTQNIKTKNSVSRGKSRDQKTNRNNDNCQPTSSKYLSNHENINKQYSHSNGHDRLRQRNTKRNNSNVDSDNQVSADTSPSLSKTNIKNKNFDENTDDDYLPPNSSNNKKPSYKSTYLSNKKPKRITRTVILTESDDTDSDEADEENSSTLEEEYEDETEVEDFGLEEETEEENMDDTDVESYNNNKPSKSSENTNNRHSLKRKKIQRNIKNIKRAKGNHNDNYKGRKSSLSAESEHNNSLSATENSSTDIESNATKRSLRVSNKKIVNMNNHERFSSRRTKQKKINYKEVNGSDYEYDLCSRAGTISSRGRVRKFKGRPRELRSH